MICWQEVCFCFYCGR